MEPAVDTTRPYSHATPAPAHLMSHLQLKAMRAEVMPQDITLDQPPLYLLIAHHLQKESCPKPHWDPETKCTMSIAKVEERTKWMG